jgi:hypothetical protein
MTPRIALRFGAFLSCVWGGERVGRGSYGDGLRPTWFGVGSVPTEAAPLHYAATVGFRTGTAYGRPMSVWTAKSTAEQ